MNNNIDDYLNNMMPQPVKASTGEINKVSTWTTEGIISKKQSSDLSCAESFRMFRKNKSGKPDNLKSSNINKGERKPSYINKGESKDNKKSHNSKTTSHTNRTQATVINMGIENYSLVSQDKE